MLHMQHTPVVHCAQPKASAASHDAQLLSFIPPLWVGPEQPSN